MNLLGHYKIGFWRRLKAIPFRLRNGFWSEEVWALDDTIAAFVLPRLRHLRECGHGYPGNLTAKKWDKLQAEMIWAFQYVINHNYDTGGHNISTEEGKAAWLVDEKRCADGLKLFARYFRDLWD